MQVGNFIPQVVVKNQLESSNKPHLIQIEWELLASSSQESVTKQYLQI